MGSGDAAEATALQTKALINETILRIFNKEASKDVDATLSPALKATRAYAHLRFCAPSAGGGGRPAGAPVIPNPHGAPSVGNQSQNGLPWGPPARSVAVADVSREPSGSTVGWVDRGERAMAEPEPEPAASGTELPELLEWFRAQPDCKLANVEITTYEYEGRGVKAAADVKKGNPLFSCPVKLLVSAAATPDRRRGDTK